MSRLLSQNDERQLPIAGTSIENLHPITEYFDPIAGIYQPKTLVMDYNEIDLDLGAIEVALGYTRASNMKYAEALYREGGFSGSYAELTLLNVTESLRKNTPVFSTSSEIQGFTMDDIIFDEDDLDNTDTIENGITLRVSYPRSNVKEIEKCRVGALKQIGYEDLTECFDEEGVIKIKGKQYQYRYEPLSDNKNEHSLQKFSTEAETNMLFCNQTKQNCPYRTYEKFFTYYGLPDYGNRFVLAALQAEEARYVGGNGFDFRSYSGDARKEGILRGIVYLNVWMQVIHKMEMAISYCYENEYQEALYNWDIAVAYYTGSTEDNGSFGKLLYQHANTLCPAFHTCSKSDSFQHPQSSIVENIFSAFHSGQDYLYTYDEMNQKNKKLLCSNVQKEKERIEDFMLVPMIQGLLLTVYTFRHPEDDETHAIIGATYAAAVLPLVNYCNPTDAQQIYEAMQIGRGSSLHGISKYKKVKNLLQKNYNCMKINCQDVGGIWDHVQNKYYTGTQPCTHFFSPGASSPPHTAFILFMIFMAFVPVFVLVRWRWRYIQGTKNKNSRNTTIVSDDILDSSRRIAAPKSSYYGKTRNHEIEVT